MLHPAEAISSPGEGTERPEPVTRLGGRMLWVGTAATALLMWMVVWRPIPVASAHNLAVGVALLILALALVSASLEVKTATGWLLVGANTLLIGFLVRSLPAFVLLQPPRHDTYFYLVSLLNVTQANTLEPVYAAWYSQVGQQLNWPVLQLLTAQVASWSGIAPTDVALYLPAAFGSLTYFAVGLLAYVAFASWRLAALAGVFGAFSDGVLYFQSEYQPQGLALLAVFFFLFLLVASRTAPSVRARFLMVLVGAALLFTHHGSTLFLPILVGPLILLPLVARLALAKPRAHQAAHARDAMLKVVAGLAAYGSVSVLLVVATIVLHLYYYDAIIRFIVASVDPSALFQGGSSLEPPPELWFSALRATKYVLLAISLVGIWRCLRSPTPNRLLLAVLTLSLTAGALASLVVFPGGALRFFALALPAATIFAAYVLAGGQRSSARTGRVLRSGALAFAALAVAGGIANGQSSSLPYLFADPPRSAGAWYGGALPRTDLMALAGQWVGKTDRPGRKYAVDFATRIGPFYFGHISDTRIIGGDVDPRTICRANVLVVDYQLTAEGLMEPRLRFRAADFDRVYDNGTVAVYLRRQVECKP